MIKNRFALGMLGGLALGLLDGLSAWFDPEARPELLIITLGASVKGLINGLVLAAVAPRLPEGWQVVVSGGLIGLVLSLAVAIPSGSFAAIVVPGIVIGLILGAILAKWGSS